MAVATRFLLALVLLPALGCVVHVGEPLNAGCNEHCLPIEGQPVVEEDVMFTPKPAIPMEHIRRAPPPPEPTPPGRFSPVPVRPVFSPQGPSGW